MRGAVHTPEWIELCRCLDDDELGLPAVLRTRAASQSGADPSGLRNSMTIGGRIRRVLTESEAESNQQEELERWLCWINSDLEGRSLW